MDAWFVSREAKDARSSSSYPHWGGEGSGCNGTVDGAEMRGSGDIDVLEKASGDWTCIAWEEKGSKAYPVWEVAFRVWDN